MRNYVVILLAGLLVACSSTNSSNRATMSSNLENRLIDLGYSKEEASQQIASLSQEERDTFNNSPEQIKKSGIIILGGLISSSVHSNNQKKANENLQEQVNELKMKDEVEMRVDEKLNQAR